MSNNKVLILGADGMLGNAIFKYLKLQALDIYGTSRKQESNFVFFDVHNFSEINFSALIKNIKPNYIINCIGYIRPKNDSVLELNKSLFINSLFPQNLSIFCLNNNIKLIHFSTDCIFNGKNAPYQENAQSDEVGIYGVSKFLGEVRQLPNITIRTSLIGHELESNRNLINWFLNNKDKEVDGFSEVYWNGISTLTAAKIIFKIINNKLQFNKPIIQLASNTVSKYDLLNILKKVYRKDIVINSVSSLVANKTLVQSSEQETLFNGMINDLEQQIFDLKKFYE